ncbi:MAG: FtsX-like permease family protein [Treponema sp.]|nr:FtsX-like permease family protein [Treponema sp.]
MIFKLAYKSVVSRKSSFVIILFISFAVCLFCVANAVFDSTEQGVQTTYVSSFTGDLIVRPSGKLQLSLFGDETPITGELTTLNTVVPYKEITDYIKSQENVQAVLGQISGIAAMEYGGVRTATYLFGVNGDEYAAAMSSIKILEGQPYTQGQKGVMLCKNAVEKLGASLGETIQFIVTDGPYVRIRAAPLTAIFEYEVYNSIFDRFAIVDADTVRSLLDISDSVSEDNIEIAQENTTLLNQYTDFDFDSLFDDAGDTDAIWDDFFEEDTELPEEEIIEETVEEVKEEPVQYVPSSTWNFLIIRLKSPADAKKTISKLNRVFKKNNWPVQATDWRHAAGSTCLYLYWMRIILNIGITIVLFAGFIIVNNTLVINVLDRIQEIGTMRAIGTKKRYISLQCMIETFILTLTSGVIGVLLGVWCCSLITKAHIVLTNSFLIQLFGSEAITVFVTGGNVLKMFGIVILLGIIGWIYPVINAVRVSPVVAMQGAR